MLFRHRLCLQEQGFNRFFFIFSFILFSQFPPTPHVSIDPIKLRVFFLLADRLEENTQKKFLNHEIRKRWPFKKKKLFIKKKKKKKKNINFFLLKPSSAWIKMYILFSYTIVTIYEHNIHQFKDFFKNIFSIFFTFSLAKKSFKFSKYRNIQESSYCSQVLLLITTNWFVRNTTCVIGNIVIKWKFSAYWGQVLVQIKNVPWNNFHPCTSKQHWNIIYPVNIRWCICDVYL